MNTDIEFLKRQMMQQQALANAQLGMSYGLIVGAGGSGTAAYRQPDKYADCAPKSEVVPRESLLLLLP